MRKRAHPPLLDELIIASELPGNEFLRIPWCKIKILIKKGSSNIFPLQHVLGLELNGEVRGWGLEAIYLYDVDDFDRTFG